MSSGSIFLMRSITNEKPGVYMSRLCIAIPPRLREPVFCEGGPLLASFRSCLALPAVCTLDLAF